MAKRGAGPAPFLTKTHQMVEAPETDDIISWGEEGKSFVVRKPVEFARDLLPVHFKHNNFSSFVRQLNTYVSQLFLLWFIFGLRICFEEKNLENLYGFFHQVSD
jgi:HSF-type DNA-binding